MLILWFSLLQLKLKKQRRNGPKWFLPFSIFTRQNPQSFAGRSSSSLCWPIFYLMSRMALNFGSQLCNPCARNVYATDVG